MRRLKILNIQQGIIIWIFDHSCWFHPLTYQIEQKTLNISIVHLIMHHVMEIIFLRFKKEEVKIEAWESRQRAKIESEMRKIEVHYHFACLYPVHLDSFLKMKWSWLSLQKKLTNSLNALILHIFAINTEDHL